MGKAAICLLVAGLGSGIANADPGNQFDLICDGTTKTVRGEHPHHMRIAVDLDAKLFCYVNDDCNRVVPIKSFTDYQIDFLSSKDAEMEIAFSVNRIDGTYSYLIDGLQPDMAGLILSNGICQAAAFSGLPKKKF
ncbi:MAG: hypothetical protein QM698_07710 [Micropepsaceae bacterium]